MDIKTSVRKVTMILGVLCTSLSGLFFILFTDLYLRALSTQLFVGILFSILSVVLFILAESFRHKPSLFNLFKILGAVFAALFLAYLIYFMFSDVYEVRTYFKLLREFEGKKVTVLNKNFTDAIDIEFNKTGVYITSIVVAALGVVAQVVNTVINNVIGID